MALNRGSVNLSVGEALFVFSRRILHKPYREKHFGDGLTSWFEPEGRDLDSLTAIGWEPACETITGRSGVPRNAHFHISRSSGVAQILKITDFVGVTCITPQLA